MSLSISALGGYDTFYPIYSVAPVNRVDAADRVGRDSRNIKTEPNDKVKKANVRHVPKGNMWMVPMNSMFPLKHPDTSVLRILPPK